MPSVKRAPKPTLWQEKAELTRRRIAQAARRLFATRGYGATTLTAIAAEAGVAVQTVYAVYRSKAGILRALREEVLREPGAEALFGEAMAARRASGKLELFARSIRRRWESGHDVVAINEDAGATDPAVRREVEALLTIRRKGLAQIARSIGSDLMPGLGVPRATAVLDALTLPALYAELVIVHGWSPDEFESWLAGTLKRQLLGA